MSEHSLRVTLRDERFCDSCRLFVPYEPMKGGGYCLDRGRDVVSENQFDVPRPRECQLQQADGEKFGRRISELERELAALRQRSGLALHWARCADVNCGNVPLLGPGGVDLVRLQIRSAISWLEGKGEEEEESHG